MKKLIGLGVLIATLVPLKRAEACGCFAPTTVATPVVQAGERILFAQDGSGNVIAYIQIKYQGAADQFGWLLPLPSVPTLQLGTDELFNTLDGATRPTFTLTTNRQFCGGGSSSSRLSLGGCGAEESGQPAFGSAADGGLAADMGAVGEVVVQSSIGPFDYAVLHADSQQEMLDWLSTNKYFVPGGTDQVLAPYIHPGAYFLALKLHAGESAGDVVPVIVKYQSALPMIPIILTSVGAVPDMGIQVWELGQHRAIPRNYRHIVLDDMPVWLGKETYEQLMIRAVREAPEHHAFITEYAGSSAPMVGLLDPPGRFGDATVLKGLTQPTDYLSYLTSHGFVYDSTLLTLLEKYLPIPAEWQSIPPSQYYMSYGYYSSQGPMPDGGAMPAFDPVGLTDELESRIVQPTLATGALFRQFPYLTRLYTALSPEDMTADPVFSENPDLPDVAAARSATLTYPCQGSGYLTSDQTGLQSQFPGSYTSVAASLRIETLREGGDPIVDSDNHDAIVAALGPVDYGQQRSSGGCALTFPAADRGMLVLFVFALLGARFILRRRRA
jgi:hypothetical protein